MKKLEIIDILEENIKTRSEICINRKRIDLNAIYGIPLIMGENHLLIQYLYDFQLDGYVIIRIRDITSIKSEKSQEFSNYILKEEGIFSQVKEPPITILNKWENIFTSLFALNISVIIECENIDKRDFFIGKIIKVNRTSLQFLHFNEVGEWDKEPTNINYKDITSVKFGDRYSTIMSKYVK